MANLPSEGIAFNFTPPIKPALSTEECAYRKGQGQTLQPLSLLSCTPPHRPRPGTGSGPEESTSWFYHSLLAGEVLGTLGMVFIQWFEF